MINLGDDILPDPGQNLSIDVFPKENSIQQGQNSCMTEEAMAQFMNEFDSTKEEILFFHAEFKAYDSDADGAITINDLRTVFGEHIHDDVLKEWIKKHNGDNEEKVVFNEFLRHKKEPNGFHFDEMLAYLLRSKIIL